MHLSNSDFLSKHKWTWPAELNLVFVIQICGPSSLTPKEVTESGEFPDTVLIAFPDVVTSLEEGTELHSNDVFEADPEPPSSMKMSDFAWFCGRFKWQHWIQWPVGPISPNFSDRLFVQVFEAVRKADTGLSSLERKVGGGGMLTQNLKRWNYWELTGKTEKHFQGCSPVALFQAFVLMGWWILYSWAWMTFCSGKLFYFR